MVGWHHQLDGHELEQTPGDGEGQGGLHAAVRGVTKSQARLSACDGCRGKCCCALSHLILRTTLQSRRYHCHRFPCVAGLVGGLEVGCA